MLASQLLRRSLRRWYVILAGLLATAALTVQTFETSEPTYEIQGTAVLLPGSSTVPEGGNGLLYLGGLNPALEVLMRSVNSNSTSREILGTAPTTTTYSVERDFDASGPIMLVTATSGTQADARATLRKVLDILPVRLAELQTDVAVPDAARMSVLDLAVDQKPVALTNDSIRGVLTVAAGGLVATLLITALIDGLVLSIARRRKAKQGEVAEETPTAEEIPTAEETPPGVRPTSKRRAAAAAQSSVSP